MFILLILNHDKHTNPKKISVKFIFCLWYFIFDKNNFMRYLWSYDYYNYLEYNLSDLVRKIVMLVHELSIWIIMKVSRIVLYCSFIYGPMMWGKCQIKVIFPKSATKLFSNCLQHKFKHKLMYFTFYEWYNLSYL